MAKNVESNWQLGYILIPFNSDKLHLESAFIYVTSSVKKQQWQ
jgi:hypothetical protein